MKVGIILICRYNSSRLPGKILRPLNGQKVIDYILQRLLTIANKEEIIVATSTESTDEPIAQYCEKNDLNYFRGSLNNVSERFLRVMEAEDLDYGVRVNGDNLLCDVQSLAKMLEIAYENKYDLITNVMPGERTFPPGMSVEIIKRSAYEKYYPKFSEPEDFEHVTWYLYRKAKDIKTYHYKNKIAPEAVKMKLALDTPEDFRKLEQIVGRMQKDHTEYHLPDVYDIYKTIEHE